MARKGSSAAAMAAGDGLFVVEPAENAGRRPGRRRTGRHERQLDRSVRELRLDDARHAAVVSAARALACQLDRAEDAADPYATAQLARPYRDLLIDLGLVENGGGGGDDELEGLGAASLGDSADGEPG